MSEVVTNLDGRSSFRPGAEYVPLIGDDENRIALNSLTLRLIARAAHETAHVDFITKGVNHVGSAEEYLSRRAYYGDDHEITRAAERVLDYDCLTALLENTENVHQFRVRYPVINSQVMMGDRRWHELTARGATDATSDDWYLHRAYAEAREAVAVTDAIEKGVLDTHEVLTISNTSTASNASDYFVRKNLMIRLVSLDKNSSEVVIDQLMMHHLPVEVIDRFFETIGVSSDDEFAPTSSDQSVRHLASRVLVRRGVLANGSADIARMLDASAQSVTGVVHAFGKPGSTIAYDEYAAMAEASAAKEVRVQSAKEFLRSELCKIAVAAGDKKSLLRQALKAARSMVADIEGVAHVRERYGDDAARAYQQKQAAIAKGDMAGAHRAEQRMQDDMGAVGGCMSDLSEDANGQSNGMDAICNRLPTPGEIARCPGCQEIVRVAGTKDAIACPRADCTLEDPTLREIRLAQQKRDQARKASAQWIKKLRTQRKELVRY